MDKHIKTHPLLLLAYILIFSLTLAISFNIGFNNSFQKLNADLRSRITGTRILTAGKDPYFYIWRQSDPEEWVDFTANPEQSVSRLTLPPTALLLHIPLAKLTYLHSMLIWLLLEWVVYAGLLLVFLNQSKKTMNKAKIFILFCLFSLSSAWIYHLHLGQIYIIYTFVAILILMSIKHLKDGKVRLNLISSLALGCLIAIRPQYIVLAIPLYFLKLSKQSIAYVVAGFAGLIAISIIVFGSPSWQQYLKAMSVQSETTYLKDFLPKSIDFYYPQSAEGLEYSRTGYQGYWTRFETSIKGVSKEVFGVSITNYVSILIGVILITIITTLTHRNIKMLKQRYALILVCTLLVVTAEISTPAPRYSYYDVVLFPAIASILFSNLRLKFKFVIGVLGTALFISGFFDTAVYIYLFYTLLLILILSIPTWSIHKKSLN